MGLTTQDPYIQKEHTDLYKILKFCVNWANIEQDTAIQNLQNLQRNVWKKCPAIHTFAPQFLLVLLYITFILVCSLLLTTGLKCD